MAEQQNPLSVEDIFTTVQDAKEKVKQFCDTEFVDMKIETNNKKYLKFVCKHGARLRARSTGNRPNQHQNFLGCKASISFFKSQKDNTLKCTKIDNEHNHAVSEKLYKHDKTALTEEEIALSTNLKNGNCKPSQIRRILLQKYQKEISIQKLKNVLAKTSEEEGDGVDFAEFFEELESKGGDINWEEDPDGTIRCITFSSIKMKNAFKSSDTPLVQLDTTFSVEKARYKVMAIVYLNSATNKSEVAFMALLSDETKSNVTFALQSFKKICVQYNLIFMVDKDFGQIEALKAVFPAARILLCIFHVIKFLRNLIASAPVVVGKKDEIFQQFKRIIYASTEEEFVAEDKKFEEVVADITIKSRNDKQESLMAYYIRNWRNVAPMWVRCYRKNLPCLGDNTSNRVERFFWTLKQEIQDTFVTLPDTIKAAVHLVQFCDRRLEEKYLNATNKCLVIYDSDENIRSMNLKASKVLNDRGCIIFHQALKKLEKTKNDLKEVVDGVLQEFPGGSKTYGTTLTTCSCTIFLNHQAPCSHILFLRMQSGEPEIFSNDLFHQRYHRNESLISVLENQPELLHDLGAHDDGEDLDNLVVPGDISDPDEEAATIVLSDRQKHAKVMPVLMRIGNLIASHPTKKFLEYLDSLNELERRVRRGQNFMIQLQNLLAPVFDEEDGDNFDDDGVEIVGDKDEEAADNSVMQEELGGNENLSDHEEVPNDGETSVTNVDTSAADDTQGLDDSQDTIKQNETVEDEPSLQDLDINANLSRKRKFSDLKFKEALVTKGRPKRRTKQFCFNKTAADRKNKGKKVIKKKRKNTKKDFMEEESDSDKENSSEVQYDDDSDSDFDDIDPSTDSEVTFNLV